MGTLPLVMDLRSDCPPIYDQGALGSCTANAIAAHLDFNRHKQGEPFISPSRLFVYYNEREADGDVNSDGGSSIRESAKTVHKQGACPETMWPYDISKFTDQPTVDCYRDAVNFEALTYLRIRQVEAQMKGCLAQGFPFVCGVSVYQSFQESDGDVPMPKKSENLLGGHAILIVGYTPTAWIFRNSWGTSWGHSGYGFLPKEYLLNPDLSDDRWSLRLVK
jgi:C1A family cysteine protease